jgi:hypothetical protein
MKKILISEDAFGDLNEGFLFYEAQDFGLGDYFTACLRADIEGLKVTAGIHREVQSKRVSPAYCSILWNQMIFKTKSDKTRD